MKTPGEDQPLVSVIVPTRNSQATIAKCLKSVIQQSYRNLELIVVDNYSTDRTRDIAKKYGAAIYLKGPERSPQVNFGARKANGKYIYRVDSDFVVHPDVVQEAVDGCEKCGYDAIVIHNTSDPTISLWARVRKAERDCYKEDRLNIAARFWKKEAFSVVGGFDETLVAGDDYDLHNRLLENGFKIGRIEAEEIHIGEPKNLIEVIEKHYYYGKKVSWYLRKHPKRAMRQLSPLRASYVKNVSNFFDDPLVVGGFFVYQGVRYMAAAIGILAASVPIRTILRENIGTPFVLGFQVLLLVCGGLLIQGNSALANGVAVHAYYLLVAGMVLQLLSFLGQEKASEQKEGDPT